MYTDHILTMLQNKENSENCRIQGRQRDPDFRRDDTSSIFPSFSDLLFRPPRHASRVTRSDLLLHQSRSANLHPHGTRDLFFRHEGKISASAGTGEFPGEGVVAVAVHDFRYFRIEH